MTNKMIVSLLLVLGSFGQLHAATQGDLAVKQLNRTHVADINDYNDAALFNVKYVGSSTQAAGNFIQCAWDEK